jgi:origin recognition complex subunit 2
VTERAFAMTAYFVHGSKPSATSDNVFSELASPSQSTSFVLPPSNIPPISHTHSFSQFGLELLQGFNLLFYGFGSKREILNNFATQFCSNRGHVVIANGFQPAFNLKDFFQCIEGKISGIDALSPLSSSAPESQARRICSFFSQSPRHSHLYIIIHNIDAPAFRSPRSKSCLSLLALQPSIHLVASIDHTNAPLLFSSTDSSSRKPSTISDASFLPRGFAWLWHDLTTLSPYAAELVYADPSSISGASNVHTRKLGLISSSASAQQTGAHSITETAALHVLASVTQKAKKLFLLMGTHQLARMEESVNDAQRCALGYDMLFVLARDDFIASSDAALRSLLGEFRDHGLVVGMQVGAGSESLWIPMKKDRLASVLRQLNTEQ